MIGFDPVETDDEPEFVAAFQRDLEGEGAGEDVEIEVAPEVDDLSLSFHSTQNRRLQSDQSLDHTVELRGTTGAATCCLFHLRWQCLRIPACRGV